MIQIPQAYTNQKIYGVPLFGEQQIPKPKLKTQLTTILNLQLHWYIINPDNILKCLWDLLIFSAIILSSVIVLFMASFAVMSDAYEADFFPYDVCLEFIFFFDIVFTFFTSFYDIQNLETVYSLRKIAKRYISDIFYLDFMAIIPFFIIVQDIQTVKFLRLIRLVRFYKVLDEIRVIKIFTKFCLHFYPNSRLYYTHMVRHIYRTIFFMMIAFILLYFISALFFILVYFGSSQSTDSNYFYYHYGLNEFPIWKNSILVLYFIQTTLATVGYGDYVPISNGERIFDIFVMITGIASFSYILNKFQDIIKNNKRKIGYIDNSSELQEWILQIGRLANKPIDKSFAQKIQEYFDYYYENNRLPLVKVTDTYFNMMTQTQKHSFVETIYYDVIFQKFSQLFKYNGKQFVNKEFYFKLCFLLRPKNFKKGEFIARQCDQIDELILINEGNVESFMEIHQVKIRKFFNDGYIQGFYEGLNNQLSHLSHLAVSDCKTFYLRKDEFINLLEEYNDVKVMILNNTFNLFKITKKSFIQAIKIQFCVNGTLNDANNLYNQAISGVKKFPNQINREESLGQKMNNSRLKKAKILFKKLLTEMEAVDHELLKEKKTLKMMMK